MRRTALVLAAAILATVAALPGLALALPAESPDDTHMVDGRVRTIAQVGSNVWMGGNFTRVQRRDGSLVATVSNAVVIDSVTGQYKAIAPRLGGANSEVWDIEVYGTDVVLAGNFGGPSGSQKNLVVVDGLTGQVKKWYNSPSLRSVLAAPTLGRIYGGGTSLSAFDFATGQELWRRARTSVDLSLRPHNTVAAYRDLELDSGGQTIWAACACDTVDGVPTKALIKLNTEGIHDTLWRVEQAGAQGIGISVAQTVDSLYLAAGGNDFLARYSKAGGAPGWWRDTSGSAQAVEIMNGGVVVGGHFWEVADRTADRCGFRSSNNAATLDPFGECETRKGLVAYSFEGTLDPSWDPLVSGKYNLVWALRPDGTRLHFGGEFTHVNGVKQTHYARLS